METAGRIGTGPLATLEQYMDRTLLKTNADATNIDEELRQQLEALRNMPASALQDRYLNTHGYATSARNRAWLIRRCFQRAQEVATGLTLSQEARKRIDELAQTQGARAPAPEPEEPPRDPRLPPVGDVILREHEGRVHEILVLSDGFEYQGRHFTSLSHIAREVTGTNWNGFLWAGLSKRKKRGEKQ